MSGGFGRPIPSSRQSDMAGRWSKGIESHGVLFWLGVLAVAFVIVIVVLIMI